MSFERGRQYENPDAQRNFVLSRVLMLGVSFVIITTILLFISQYAADHRTNALVAPPQQVFATAENSVFTPGCNPNDIRWPQTFNYAPEGEVNPDQFTLSGFGNYPEKGHGIGGVQWVWEELALMGYTADQILTASYPDTKVVPAPEATVHVANYGAMSLDQYIAGIGETPDHACGSEQDIANWNAQADQLGWAPDDPRRNKFVVDNPEVKFDCMAAETIKAQAAASASYILSANTTAEKPMGTGETAQVYKGGNGKAWVVEEGYDVVADNEGKPITAFYSARPLSPFGTTQPGNMWTDIFGNPRVGERSGAKGMCFADIPGLDIARAFPELVETWRTQSFTGSDISEIFTWASRNEGVFLSADGAWLLGEVAVKAGNINDIEIELANNGIATKIWIVGENGRFSVAADLFQAAWNQYYGWNANNAIRSLVFNEIP